MIKSMTGFGASKKRTESYEFSVEAKSLNHRFFDLKFKQIKNFFEAEIVIRQIVQKYIKRGKVDLFVNFEKIKNGDEKPVIDKEKLKGVKELFNDIETVVEIKFEPTLSDFLKFKDRFLVEEESEWSEEDKKIFLETVEYAIKAVDDMRKKEGEFLKTILFEYIENLSKNLEDTKKIYDNEKERVKSNMKNKIAELFEDESVDNNRLEQELFYYFEKRDITEEIERLKSHFEQFKNILNKGGVVGRKLDFLAQEMTREVNTIASKSQNYSFIKNVVEMKTEIEKIREQVQNIE